MISGIHHCSALFVVFAVVRLTLAGITKFARAVIEVADFEAVVRVLPAQTGTNRVRALSQDCSAEMRVHLPSSISRAFVWISPLLRISLPLVPIKEPLLHRPVDDAVS